jgi:alcohol dehydrogenase
MKAAQLVKYGEQDAVETKNDVSRPVPLAGQVLVEVHAAAVNPFDWKVRSGVYQQFIPVEIPATLGGDVAGVVAEVGEDVSGFEVGQAVLGMSNAVGGQGSLAELTPVSVEQLVSKPDSVDFETAAALPLAGVSAYQALVDHIDLQPNQKILIHGGAGGIGSLAIQIAKNIGAQVTTTAAAADTDFVKALGADEVIDYETQDFAELLQDLDAVFDTVGGETNLKSYAVLKPGGSLVSMTDGPNESLVEKHGIHYTQQSSKATPERLSAVAELAATGKLKVNVDKVFPLDEAAEALEYLRTGHPKGKVVVQVKE